MNYRTSAPQPPVVVTLGPLGIGTYAIPGLLALANVMVALALVGNSLVRQPPEPGRILGLGLLFVIVFAGIVAMLRGPLQRSRAVRVRVTGEMIEVLGAGKRFARIGNEHVRVFQAGAQFRVARWVIQYGDGTTYSEVAAFVSHEGPTELDPFAQRLHHALVETRLP
jgi:hypothetical protein